jgi:hypothetical protein
MRLEYRRKPLPQRMLDLVSRDMERRKRIYKKIAAVTEYG